MKILFCWSDISGYMTACWREMAKAIDMEIFVIAFGSSKETDFDQNLMANIPHHLLSNEEREKETFIESLILREEPDVIAVAGWFHTPYRKLPFRKSLSSYEFVLCMDTPYWGTLKQQFAPVLLRSFLKKMSKVVVSGERSWQYALKLGFKYDQILKSQYSIDHDFFKPFYNKRIANAWPRKFLFVGRYYHVKAIDVLSAAYQQYREECEGRPWELVCCGKGELDHLLTGIEGVVNHGFVQPEELEQIFVNAGCFIMPSRFDPWPLSIIEACASGLPVICTDVCGTSVELVKNWYNGFTIPPDSVSALTQAMLNTHYQYKSLPEMGRHSGYQAEPYTPELWLKRWRTFFKLPTIQKKSIALV